MKIGETLIRDTFAEAFAMKFVRLIVTAVDRYWLEMSINELTGYSASVIGCDAEVGLEGWMEPSETPDGREGASVLMFGMSGNALQKAAANRVGQAVMTCPTTALFDGLPDEEKFLSLGKHLRFFGDGYQKSKVIADRRFWRVPVMDGEFLVCEKLGVRTGVAGGNLLIEGATPGATLEAARRAADVIRRHRGVMSPFPGGVVRAGSKVGSRYNGLVASTSDAYCPTLRGRVETALLPETECVYEIVVDGMDEPTIAIAMKESMHAAAGTDIVAIGAGNYGGKLGKYHFHLHKLLGSNR